MKGESVDQAGYEKVLERLLAIEIQGAKIETKLDGNHKAFRDFEVEMKEINSRMRNTVYGNGHPGLVTKVESIASLKQWLQDHSKNDAYFFTTIIGLLLFIMGRLFIWSPK